MSALGSELCTAPQVLWYSADVEIRQRLRGTLGAVGFRAAEVEQRDLLATAVGALRPDLLLLDLRRADPALLVAVEALAAARPEGTPRLAGLVGEAGPAPAWLESRCAWASPEAAREEWLRLLYEAAVARRRATFFEALAATAPTPLAAIASAPDYRVAWANAAFAALIGERLPPVGAEAGLWFDGLPDPHRLVLNAGPGQGSAVPAQLRPFAPGGARPGGWLLALSPAGPASSVAGHQMREENEQRRRFTETLLDQLTAGVVTADLGARVTFANRMATETLGLEAANCLGRDLVEMFGDVPALRRSVAALAEGGEERVDLVHPRADGRRAELGMTLIRSREGAPADMAFVALFRDLGARRQFDRELRRVERLSAIGSMVAGFAHELRNPLAGIQALAEALLAESEIADPRREYGTRILALLSRVERFVKEALQFGEPQPPDRQRQEPRQILERALGVLTPRWGRRGAPPATSYADTPAVFVDGDQVGECLLALIENALDAAGDASRVQVRLSTAAGLPGPEPRMVRFDVCDQGPGIAPGDLSRIFDPFFTTKPKGTGLGLALAQTLVRENGGRLLVRSTPGLETVFSLLLPEAPE